MGRAFREQLYSRLNQKSTDQLIEVWQTNNRLEWSNTAFDVIQEILLERLAELPSQNEPITKATGKEKIEEQAEKLRFRWMLPVLGAVGFGIGFALTGAIMRTIHDVVRNSVARDFDLTRVGIHVGAFRGILAGGIGGAGLGLAHRDKTRAYYFSLAGAIGFGIAFALVISVDAMDTADIGWEIIRLMGGPAGYPSLETELAFGLGVGAVVGAIGGLVLGIAAPKYRVISSLLLCFAGILSLGNVFAFGWTIYVNSLWNALGGLLGGAALGVALALHYLIVDLIHRKRNGDQVQVAGTSTQSSAVHEARRAQ